MRSAVEDIGLSVRRDGDAFVVRVDASPAGTTPELRTTAAELDRLVDDIRPHGEVTRDIGASGPTGRSSTDLGPALFRALFPDAAGDRFHASCDRAAAAGATLRLVLRLDIAADALPWEQLVDPETGRPLALRHPIVRAIDGADQPRAAIDGPLRVLVVVSTPPGAAPLDAGTEVQGLRDTLDRFVESAAIHLRVVTATTLADLTRELEDGPWHVVHYVGHGTIGADGAGTLVLHDDAAGHELVPGPVLANALTARAGVHLVVLNACSTAVADGGDPFAGTAAALVRAGVPTVVAMRRPITDDAAIAFAGALYAGLVSGASIDEAVTSARRSLHGTSRFGAEWATPVLVTSVRGASVPIVPHADDDVRFTVARPAGLRAARWETMLVLAHRGDRYVGERGETVDPQAEVTARIQTLFGAEAATTHRTTIASAGAIPRGTELVVDADVPGVEAVVRDSPLTWRGDLAEVLVQLRAPVTTVGQSVVGWVRVFSGPLLVAEAEVRFAVVADGGSLPTAPAPAAMRRFRRIFPCFSPDDTELVRGLAATAAALGDVEYVEGVLDHDATAPDDWMVPALLGADVFQLFWSTTSMTSARCRRQWEAAVALDRADFVRPLYWERPMPRAPGLPPPELTGLRFVGIPAPALDAGAVAPGAAPPPVGAAVPPPSIDISGQRTPPPPPPTAAPPRRPARRPALGVAALSLLGGLAGLVVGIQSSTVAGDLEPVVETTVNWVLPVVGLVVGALIGMALAIWWRRRRRPSR